jgi:hypothetical protein
MSIRSLRQVIRLQNHATFENGRLKMIPVQKRVTLVGCGAPEFYHPRSMSRVQHRPGRCQANALRRDRRAAPTSAHPMPNRASVFGSGVGTASTAVALPSNSSALPGRV